MKNKYELIVFDLDGTLIDTLRDLNSAVNFALSKNGYPIKDLEHTRRSIGNGVAMLIRRSVPDGIDERSYQRVLADFENHYRFHSSDMTSAYNGMKQALEYLKEKKYLLAVSTNKIEDVAMSLINHFYCGLFDVVVGDNGIRAKKPAPDSINEIMRRLRVKDRSKIVYIGDTEVDHQTAVNSKVDCMLVTYGYRREVELARFEFDDELIRSPVEIKQHF